MNIEHMKPGPEMDHLVAEIIMDWRPDRETKYWTEKGHTTEWPVSDDTRLGRKAFSPSTRVGHLEVVMKRMRELGFAVSDCALGLVDRTGCDETPAPTSYRFRIGPAPESDSDEEWNASFQFVQDFPVAVCKVCLRAVLDTKKSRVAGDLARLTGGAH